MCTEPLDGEPGQSADGKVCTLTLIGACTEEGRRFSDYASCDDVRTQQPYYPASPGPDIETPAPRMDDPTYVAELNWVREQAEACACVCCHSADAPGGPAIWDTDAEGNWINTFTDESLQWTSGRVRYLSVLEAGAANPGVPPNRDLPEGTLWRVDTVPPAAPMKTGEVVYGEVPAGTQQVLPDDGNPPPLTSGETYLLYVQTDLMLPSTRCLFEAP